MGQRIFEATFWAVMSILLTVIAAEYIVALIALTHLFPTWVRE